ncbi:hypothetical protein BV25DRAFT_1832532 [Artomyces pyxidatus]|uniref:Uncharacterized protein n=1 Tax=Artomyces pyxidatus TaxID=48021 RepID=A0ACB8SI97_9AGAM|nr:hypothetical protein BV25DRAFT_1832532 [Artomyces pyxidatus]
MSENAVAVLPLPSLSTQSALPAINDAAAPFDDEHADIILRSSDDVDFRVHKLILRLASPIFSDMFSLPSPVPTSLAADETRHGLPVVKLAEDANTLDFILRWSYPVATPKVAELRTITLILDAARKYGIDALYASLAADLSRAVDSDALGVFAVATSFGLEVVAALAAVHSLALPLELLDSAELSHLSIYSYNKLLQYRFACGKSASAVTKKRNWFGRTDCPQVVRVNRGAGSFGSSTFSCAQCYTRDPWDTAQNWQAPLQYWNYLTQVGDLLTHHPHTSVVLSAGLVPSWVACANCRTGDKSNGFDSFTRCLAEEVGAAVAQVPVPKFC